jgi:hypothetical protein
MHNTFSSDWKHDCGGPNHTTLDGCQFAEDYKSMIELVKTLGTTAAGPMVYVRIIRTKHHDGESHLPAMSVLYWGLFQNGLELFFSIILPQAPIFVIEYLPLPCFWSRMI